MAGATNKSGAADSAREPTFREKWQEHWIAKLRRTLPEALFRECVFRLQEGEPAIAVARWLLTVPDRGGMRGVTNIHTMRRYVEGLRVRVRAAKKKIPLPAITAKQLKKAVEQERRRADNAIALEGGPMKRPPEPTPAPPNSPAEREPANVIATEGEPTKSEASPTPPPPAPQDDRAVRQNQSMIDYVVARNAKASDRRIWLSAVAEMNWDRLKLAWFMEEKFKMPLVETTKISNVIIKAAEADTRAELAGIAKQKQLREKAMVNWDPITIESIPPDDPARAKELSPYAQELRKQVKAMSVEDRMLAGGVLDNVLHIVKLSLDMKRAEEAAKKHDTPSEGDKCLHCGK